MDAIMVSADDDIVSNNTTWSKVAMEDLINHPGAAVEQPLFLPFGGLARQQSNNSLGLVRDTSFRWSEISQLPVMGAQNVTTLANQSPGTALEAVETTVHVGVRNTRNSKKRQTSEDSAPLVRRNIRYKQDASAVSLLQPREESFKNLTAESSGDSDEGESMLGEMRSTTIQEHTPIEQECLVAATSIVASNMASMATQLSNAPMGNLPLSTTNAAIAALDRVDSTRSLSDYLSDEMAAHVAVN